MFGIDWRRLTTLLLGGVIVIGLSLGVVGCGGSSQPTGANSGSTLTSAPLNRGDGAVVRAANIAEVSPPAAIQELREFLEQYQPQVAILSPKPEAVLQDNSVSVQFQVVDLPLFKDAKLGLGPHLHVLLDNQNYQAVYDVSQPLLFSDLTPGTHTLRVFASRPWHESFKNEGAYAQVTFHVLTKTQENNPDPQKPLLTYSRPQGAYGAEPIMLDYYLSNAPLHLIAQENPSDEVTDWRIRCTINGNSFVTDRWQPLYLQGFKPGKNWVQLELLDEQGQPIANVFNATTRIVTYEPGGKDTLSRLVRGELKASEVRSIVAAGAQSAQPVAPTSPTPSPSLSLTKPSPRPLPEETPAAKPSEPAKVPVTPLIPLVPQPEKLSPEPLVPSVAAPVPEKSNGWLDGFQKTIRKAIKSSPTPEPSSAEPKAIKIAPKSQETSPLVPSDRPQPQPTLSPVPKLTATPELTAPAKAPPKIKIIEPTPKASLLPEVSPGGTNVDQKTPSKPLSKPAIAPSPSVIKSKPQPESEPSVSPQRVKEVPPIQPSAETPSPKPEVTPQSVSKTGKSGGWLDRFQQSESKPTPTVVVPQSKVTPIPVTPALKPSPAPLVSPAPVLKGEKTPSKPLSKPTIAPSPSVIKQSNPQSKSEPSVSPQQVKEVPQPLQPSTETPSPKPEVTPQPVFKTGKSGGWLDRFQQSESKPTPTVVVPPSKVSPIPVTPALKPSPAPLVSPAPVLKDKPELRPLPSPLPKPVPSVAPVPEIQPSPVKQIQEQKNRLSSPEVDLRKVLFPPSSTGDNLKIIRPEATTTLPSRYLKKSELTQEPSPEVVEPAMSSISE